MKQVKIIDVRAYVLEQAGCGGDYHDREQGHWLVDTLIDEIIEPGYHTVQWNASKVSSGIYFYKLTSDNQSITKKLVLMK